MTAGFVREAPARAERAVVMETLSSISRALAEREIWIVAGFIFFFNFSPSFGPALVFYQTDVLRFDQQFIGHLGAPRPSRPSAEPSPMRPCLGGCPCAG